VCLHQILLYNGEKYYGNLSNVMPFGKQAVGNNKSFCMVFQGQKQCASVEDDKQNK
jgi:hypothetical protein